MRSRRARCAHTQILLPARCQGEPAGLDVRAAAGALNLATGERHADVEDDVRRILQDLKREGNNGYGKPKKNTAYGTMVKLHIGKLKKLGYTSDFVAGYLVGSGLHGDSGENLKRIYG